MTDWRARKWTNVLLLAVAAALVVSLVQLGNWQMRRLDWKVNLIDAVESRAFGVPVEAPSSDQWAGIAADSHAYLKVAATGTLLHDREIAVSALTELGSGYWILTPLARENGETIWINRGFVPPELRTPESRIEGREEAATVIGLLRVSEPGGTFLQANKPQSDRWYSRDVAAFSLHRSLSMTAPYFIDAGNGGDDGEWPRGGLTRINFRNTHLAYALTWYAMAALLAGGVGYVVWLVMRPQPEDDV